MTDVLKTIAEMPALKPCPFCGGDAEVMRRNNSAFVRCRECRAESYESGTANVIAAWNRRAIPLPDDDAPTETKHGERIDYTAAQIQAMGEAYAAAYADAKAKQNAEDAEMVERIIENAAFRAALDAYLVAVGDNKLEDEFEAIDAAARAALSAMRGEP